MTLQLETRKQNSLLPLVMNREARSLANRKNAGVKVVLTASATEMSEFYNNHFIAFAGGFAIGYLPLQLARKSLYPPVEQNLDGRAKFAPYGLRKVEALLLESGFSEDEVAVVHPKNLEAFVGPETKVVGISSMDPMGMAYVSKTYSSILGGGEPLNAVEFRKLMNHHSIKRFKPKIIVGGFGSWQLERKKIAESYGADCVFIGGNPELIVEVFRKAVEGEVLPRVVHADKVSQDYDYEKMPLIKHGAIHGEVEISKGCGRNCQFCTPTMQKKIDVPLDKIMEEVKTTIKEGGDCITLITEDIFLYGTKDKLFIPKKQAVVKLVKSICNHPGVRRVQVSHMSLAPVVCDPDMVKEVAEILITRNWYSHNGKPIVTAETGIETGSTRLIRKYMMGKMLPYRPEQWQEIVTHAFGILNDNNWYPLATLIIGLPDEKEEDVLETLELMDKLKGYKAFYVPLLFVPLENCLLMNENGAEIDALSRARWEFFIRCWEYNVQIWRRTFLENRFSNLLILKIVNNLVIPSFAIIAGAYYGRKHGEMLKKAFWRLGKVQK